ncbi:CDP-glucose 4,6-dehydratase [bacterium]|nr:CDP-glucose 4,6-dehydratase [bacterium]
MFKHCYKDKKVLITGHTGFKGSWLSLWLTQLGAKVLGLSNGIPTEPSNFIASSIGNIIEDRRIDVRNLDAMRSAIHDFKPDYIFHLAAQPLVRKSFENPIETIEINALGCAILLDALRNYNKRVVAIIITSDKAYDNIESVWGYRENDRLGGKDPYSASKGMAELAIRAFVESYFSNQESDVRVGIGRAGNVIGGGDWADCRIVPDCMNAWSRNKSVDIRNPNSTRPWQHVLEPLSGYLKLGHALYENNVYNGEAYNFGPSASQDKTVVNLIKEMSKHWDQVSWNDASPMQGKLTEAVLLKLNCDKALSHLNWLPTMTFEETVSMTVQWYKYYYVNNGNTMLDYSLNQIAEYSRLANKRSEI